MKTKIKTNLKLLAVSLASLAMLAIFIGCSEDAIEDAIVNNSDLNIETAANEPMNEHVGKGQVIPNQYIVVYYTDYGKTMTTQASKDAVLRLTKKVLGTNKSALDLGIKHIYSKSINGVTLTLNETQRIMLKKDTRIKRIAQDQIVHFAPPCGTPNGGPCDPGVADVDAAQETPWGIDRVNGGVTYTGNNVAWVLDTGIDLDHPDLNVDASRGFNAFTSGTNGLSLDDGNGHGSHVARTIGALDNGFGVIGVAAGATVIPVKVLDSDGDGSWSGVIAGVDHVAANGGRGDVANMSLGGDNYTLLDDAVAAAAETGVRFILAAGNGAEDANNRSPARVNGDHIYTISSMSQGDNWSSFSNFGNPPVDYCAPGSSIKSTFKNGGYTLKSGTSIAAPHAAGVLLLGNASTDGTVNGDPDAIIVH